MITIQFDVTDRHPLTWGWTHVCVKPGPSGVINEQGALWERVPLFRCKCFNHDGEFITGSMTVLVYPSAIRQLHKERWTITSDGVVSPSVLCSHESCGFHEFIKLAGFVNQDGLTLDNDLKPLLAS